MSAGPRIAVVSATRLDEPRYREESALSNSLRRLADPRIVAHVAHANREPLPLLYNRAIDDVDADVLVFMHDDVWIDDYFFSERLLSGLGQFDLIGVAGTRKRRPRQKAWSFVDDPRVRDDAEFLSGRVAQGQNPFGVVQYFGPSPAACEMLDGVLLAARRATLQERRVRFDPRFAFHFYDLDFCRAATSAGLRPGTWPICITHQSRGDFSSAAWQAALSRYLEKWPD